MLVEKINGHKVLAMCLLEDKDGMRKGRTYVLVEYPGIHDQYVVAAYTLGDDEWLNGQYFKDLPTAIERFAQKWIGKLGL